MGTAKKGNENAGIRPQDHAEPASVWVCKGRSLKAVWRRVQDQAKLSEDVDEDTGGRTSKVTVRALTLYSKDRWSKLLADTELAGKGVEERTGGERLR